MSLASIDPTPEHRLRYDEAVRAIDHQLDSVDAARTRAGLLLAALAITAVEVGGRAVDRAGNPFPVSQALAWTSLLACAGALLFAMWPRNLKGSLKVERLSQKPADHLMQDIALDLTFRRAEVESQRVVYEAVGCDGISSACELIDVSFSSSCILYRELLRLSSTPLSQIWVLGRARLSDATRGVAPVEAAGAGSLSRWQRRRPLRWLVSDRPGWSRVLAAW